MIDGPAVAGRGVLLFLGAWAGLVAAASVLRPGMDLGRDWIDLRPLTARWSALLTGAAGALFVAAAIAPCPLGPRFEVTRAFSLALAAAALVNSAGRCVGRAGLQGAIGPLFLATALAFVFVTLRRPVTGGPGSFATACVVAGACAFAFSLAQGLARRAEPGPRRADAIVVFGARVFSDGSLSDRLRERMIRACRLWMAGQAPTLILSGGPGDGPVHETEAMHRFAAGSGVPATALMVDPGGISVSAMMDNSARLLDAMNARTVIVVAHPSLAQRIGLAYSAAGIDLVTPATADPSGLAGLPVELVRCAAAWWLSVGRTLAGL